MISHYTYQENICHIKNSNINDLSPFVKMSSYYLPLLKVFISPFDKSVIILSPFVESVIILSPFAKSVIILSPFVKSVNYQYSFKYLHTKGDNTLCL